MYTEAFGKTALNAQLHCDTWKFAPTKKVNLSLFMISCVAWRVDDLTTYDQEGIDVFLWASHFHRHPSLWRFCWLTLPGFTARDSQIELSTWACLATCPLNGKDPLFKPPGLDPLEPSITSRRQAVMTNDVQW
jgi:hypothetical protein